MLVILDTNIIVSTLLFRGQAAPLYRAIREGRIRPLHSPSIREEYERVLHYPKFGLSPEEIDYLIHGEIDDWAIACQEPDHITNWIPEDPDDNRFIDLALSIPEALLVSGDRHLLENRHSLPCSIATLREILEVLSKA